MFESAGIFETTMGQTLPYYTGLNPK